MSWPTLAERKQAAVARNAAAVELAIAELQAMAARLGGRFILFGSAAPGAMRHDSDVDLLIDFPTDVAPDDADAAERILWSRGLTPDMRPFGLAGSRLRERALAEGIVIGASHP
jgi:hypothetical protein